MQSIILKFIVIQRLNSNFVVIQTVDSKFHVIWIEVLESTM